MLSQYDDDKVLYSMIFYNKSFNLIEINYHIYNKKLLIIIRCFEHWHFELAYTKLLIQIFIDHQKLTICMKNKQLIHCQARYLNILFDFNFKIIFRTDKTNIKVDVWIYILNFTSKTIMKEFVNSIKLFEFQIECKFWSTLQIKMILLSIESFKQINKKNSIKDFMKFWFQMLLYMTALSFVTVAMSMMFYT